MDTLLAAPYQQASTPRSRPKRGERKLPISSRHKAPLIYRLSAETCAARITSPAWRQCTHAGSAVEMSPLIPGIPSHLLHRPEELDPTTPSLSLSRYQLFATLFSSWQMMTGSRADHLQQLSYTGVQTLINRLRQLLLLITLIYVSTLLAIKKWPSTFLSAHSRLWHLQLQMCYLSRPDEVITWTSQAYHHHQSRLSTMPDPPTFSSTCSIPISLPAPLPHLS